MKKTILLTILGLFFIGCVPKQLYHWGNYSQTLYTYKKEATNEAFQAHYQELLEIIKESEKRTLRVPPGVHGELGYLQLTLGKADEALLNFNKEKELYPESRVLMDRLILKTTKSSIKEVKYQELGKDPVEKEGGKL